MARKLVVEVVGDDASYIRTAENTIATNKKLAVSFRQTGVSAEKAAEVTVLAAAKSQAAQRERIAALTTFASTTKDPKLAEIATAQAAVTQQRLEKQLASSRTATATATAGMAGYGKAARAASEETAVLGARTAVAERDINKIVRGGLAGAGVFHELGRSLAFASTGFIAFAIGAGLIRKSIDAALAFSVAEKQVNAQLNVGGKSWNEYGHQIDTAILHLVHLAGFTETDLLASFTVLFRVTGNVDSALHLLSISADVARGRHIALSAASNALAKAAGGSFSALRRLNIIIPATFDKTQALAFVQRKYAGQAEAGTTAQQRFSATLDASERIIGTALLPTVIHLTTELGNWLSKMNESGRLQKDVNHWVSVGGDIFHTLGLAIEGVDKVTGGFANTVKILIGLEVGKMIAGWVVGLQGLTTAWGRVAGAATTAGAAQEAALGAGGVTGRRTVAVGAANVAAAQSAGLVPVIGGRGGAAAKDLKFTTQAGELTRVETQAASKFPAATAAFTNMGTALEGIAPIAAAVIALNVIESKTYKDIRAKLTQAAGGQSSFFGGLVHDLTLNITELPGEAKDSFTNMVTAWKGFLGLLHDQAVNVTKQIEEERKQLGLSRLDKIFHVGAGGVQPPTPGMFGGAQPQKQFWKTFELSFREQLNQVQAQLTKSQADDVAVARQIVARIRTLINNQQIKGPALLQALGLEASALQTIWSAEAQAAQDRAAKAQAAKQRIQQAIENSIDPITLEVALSRAELTGDTSKVVAALKALRAAAQKALSSGRLSAQQQQEALQQIISLNQQIKDAAQQATVTFQASGKLQLAIARDQALGLDDTKDLEKLKRAILKFIRTHKKNIAALIDAYGQLAAVNQQLQSNNNSFLGLFKQASTKALTSNLGLTPQQRQALRARLSQLGPHNTVPGDGTGVFGFALDPNTGRPIRPGTRRAGRDSTSGGQKIVVDNTIKLNLYIDGRHVEAVVTPRQQARAARNPGQRRGPHAGR